MRSQHSDDPYEHVVEGIREILDDLGVNYEDDNFKETPERFARYLHGHFVSEQLVQEVLDDIAQATFPSEYTGMVVESNIDAGGMCPHHLLPVAYRIAIAYLPRDRVVGLSKLIRLARVYARQALLQEDVTAKIAGGLEKLLDPRGVAIIVQGKHSCMAIRGVRAAGTTVTTSEIRGVFRDAPSAKEEFYFLLGMNGWHTIT